MILAIGSSSDQEFRAFQVIKESVISFGEEIILFEQDKCLSDQYLTFRVQGSKPRYSLSIKGVLYDADSFSAVLYLHPVLPRQLLSYQPSDHARFISCQFLELRKGLWYLLQNRKWVNDPWNAQRAENKILQLTVATEVGLEVPETLITSDPVEVQEFYERCDKEMITKILFPSPILDHVIFTNKVTSNQMEQIDTIKLCPSIFQVCLPKLYELRVTVVGQQLFCAKIHSQLDSETSIDWRRKPKLNDHDVKLEPTTIPNSVSSKILAFMKKIGLQYGCIDMVVTPEGRFIFLEINPSGQWYFVQLKTEMEIGAAIAKLVL